MRRAVSGWQPCEEAVAAIPPTFSYHNVPAASRFRLSSQVFSASVFALSPGYTISQRCAHTSSSPL